MAYIGSVYYRETEVSEIMGIPPFIQAIRPWPSIETIMASWGYPIWRTPEISTRDQNLLDFSRFPQFGTTTHWQIFHATEAWRMSICHSARKLYTIETGDPIVFPFQWCFGDGSKLGTPKIGIVICYISTKNLKQPISAVPLSLKFWTVSILGLFSAKRKHMRPPELPFKTFDFGRFHRL